MFGVWGLMIGFWDFEFWSFRIDVWVFGFGIWSLVFGVWNFGVWYLRLEFWSLGFSGRCFRHRIWSSEFEVWNFGVWEFGFCFCLGTWSVVFGILEFEISTLGF